MAKKVQFEVELDADGAIKSAKELDDQLGKTEQGADDLGGSFKGLDAATIALGGVLANLASQGLDLAIQGFKAGIDATLEYESSLAELSAITGIAGDDLERLGQTALDQSVASGVGVTDQIEAFKLLASQIEISSIGGVEGLERLGEQVILLSQASGVDLATATGAVTSAINQFGLEAEDAASVVNTLAAGSKFGAAEVGQLAESFKNAGTVASLSGLSVEQTVGALEALSRASITGAEAGTGLRNLLLRLQTANEDLAAQGITPTTLKTEGLAATLSKLRPILSDTDRVNKIFGEGAVVVASNLIENVGALEQLTTQVTDTQTALEQADIQMNTLQTSLNQLSNAITKDFIQTSREGSGEFKVLVDTIREFVDDAEPITKTVEFVASQYNFWFDAIGKVSNAIGLSSQDIEDSTEAIDANTESIKTNTAALSEAEQLEQERAEAEALRKEQEKILAEQEAERLSQEAIAFFEQKEAKLQAEIDSFETIDSARINSANLLEQTTQNEIALAGQSAKAQDAANNVIAKSEEARKVAIINRQKAEEQALKVQLATADRSIQSADDVARATLNAVRQVIQAKAAEAVASQIANVVRSVPFPFNIAAIAAATAGLNLLFNRLEGGISDFVGIGDSGGGRQFDPESERENVQRATGNPVATANSTNTANVASTAPSQKVVLSLYDLDQGQRQYNAVQIDGGL